MGRLPRLDGLSVLVRGERVTLTPAQAVDLAEALYWARTMGSVARVAGVEVSEVRGGVRLELPGGSRGVLPRPLALVWVQVLCERAKEVA
jgi:hypothetical protein